MEYRIKDSNTSWTAISGTTVDNLTPATYEVRYKSGANVTNNIVYLTEASPSEAVTITHTPRHRKSQIQIQL